MTGTALSKTSAGLAPMTQESWGILKEQAEMLVTTGFLPAAIKNANQAVAIILKGRELGIPAMYALSNVVVIQGKPAANAELMLALIYRDHGDDAVVFAETTARVATISYKRRGWTRRQQFSFTAEDASKAGLTGENWRKYPAAMLRARCISAVARLAFPDTIAGMYTPEELGAAVHGETGEVLGLPPEPATAHNGAASMPKSIPAQEPPTPAPAPQQPAKRYTREELYALCLKRHEEAIAEGLMPEEPPGQDAPLAALMAYGARVRKLRDDARAELERPPADDQEAGESPPVAEDEGAPPWPSDEPVTAVAKAGAQQQPRRAG